MLPHHPEPGNGPLAHSVAIAGDRCRGSVAAGCAEALAPLFAALPEPTGLTIVKSSTVRTVLRGVVGGIDVHVKVFRSANLAARARDSLRGDRGRREAQNLARAAALGLPVVEPLAHGLCETPEGPRSFLVTRTVPGARPFAFAADAATLRRVGALLRHAHDRGFLPGDLHPGNVVVDAAGQVFLLDLTSVRHAGEPDGKRRAAALAFFCQELDGGPLDPAAKPLLDGYLERPLGYDLAPRLAQAARAVRWRALAAFGRRSARACRHTDVPPHRRSAVRWYWSRIHACDDPERLRAACRAFLAEPPSPSKRGRRGAVFVLDDFVVKRREQGAARTLFRAAYLLHYAGVPQPAPIALATFDGTGHVFAERLPGPSLHDELLRGALDEAACVAAAARLGEAVGRLHAHGLRNRDLKFENLVRRPDGTVCMVDLDGVRRARPSDARGQGADLGRVLAAFRGAGEPGGRTAALTFVRAYLRARQRLLQPALRRVFARAGERAREWASAHR